MGTILSPFPHDAIGLRTFRSANLRRHAILRYAAPSYCLSISRGCPVTLNSGPFDQLKDRSEGPEWSFVRISDLARMIVCSISPIRRPGVALMPVQAPLGALKALDPKPEQYASPFRTRDYPSPRAPCINSRGL